MRELVAALDSESVKFDELVSLAREKGLFERLLAGEGELKPNEKSTFGKLLKRWWTRTPPATDVPNISNRFDQRLHIYLPSTEKFQQVRHAFSRFVTQILVTDDVITFAEMLSRELQCAIITLSPYPELCLGDITPPVRSEQPRAMVF